MTLRRDAARNRDRIVVAAQSAFVEQGLDVPLEVIAERAGVGIGTLYRRFSCRDELIAAAFADRLTAYARLAEAALGEPDPWVGFAGFVAQICEMQAADRGLGNVFTRSVASSPGLDELRDQSYRSVVRLIERARLAGSLRPDFSPEDLPLLLMANAGVVESTGSDAPAASRRFVGLMLDSFRAESATDIPPPLDPRVMYRAMRRVARG